MAYGALRRGRAPGPQAVIRSAERPHQQALDSLEPRTCLASRSALPVPVGEQIFQLIEQHIRQRRRRDIAHAPAARRLGNRLVTAHVECLPDDTRSSVASNIYPSTTPVESPAYWTTFGCISRHGIRTSPLFGCAPISPLAALARYSNLFSNVQLAGCTAWLTTEVNSPS